MIKTVIFDFDGTIADSMMLVEKILFRLADKYGYKNIKNEEVELLRNMKAQDVLKALGIPIYKLIFFANRVKKELNRDIESTKPASGIKLLLTKLKKKGIVLGILSSNLHDSINKFLEKNDLELFDFIHTGNSIFGKHRLLKNLLKKRKLLHKEVLYVGDETRDIEAAQKAKVKVIAVTWGFNKKEILRAQNPDYLVDKPQKILNIV